MVEVIMLMRLMMLMLMMLMLLSRRYVWDESQQHATPTLHRSYLP